MDDNFFEIGGDSILAIKLITIAISKNISITYSDLFKNTDKYIKEEEAVNPMVGIPQPEKGGEMNPSAQLLANNNQVTQ